ncbi:MAG: electron transport complex subunit RsxE [Gemmatimonadaceae bacterium 4484_173]|jgi:electron transport complex protein RnfE|nr:MAG: electron transport complex subunit RsxE [Gemmatimonadaceae bacterium 4484_173]RKZ04652.1 MAG: electron transport complex subunit RsxE [Candidatus Fermentibacteria bacterium]
MSLAQNFSRGIVKDNPIFKQVLGMCPFLAVTTSVENALGMGAAATFVLVFSNFLVSLFRKVIPSKVRIPSYIVIIATFVTLVDLLMNAYLPALHQSLGIFIPLIVVNCIILGRAEGFANKNKVLPSILDGIGMGLGFTLAMVVMATFREILGNGSWLGFNLLGESYQNQPLLIAILAPGAFIIMAFILGFFNIMEKRKRGGVK